jgi:hypothetical protein
MPTFYHSAELRWFVRSSGDNWQRAHDWFAPADPALQHREPERTDAYLQLPASITVGVKQRQGRFEIKTQTVAPRLFEPGTAGISGHLDEWVKWSFASRDPAALEVELLQAGPWRTVIKDRHLQKYAEADGTISPASPADRPDQGCNVELTRLAFSPGQWDWFTIGFEAFGPPARVSSILTASAERFFAQHAGVPLALQAADSLGYPEFLLRA